MKIVSFLIIFLAVAGVSSADMESWEANKPFYIKFDECSAHAKYFIRQKNIPEDFFHSCSDQEKYLNQEKVHFIHVEYGKAQDCFAGCFYENIYGVVAEDFSYFGEVPGSKVWLIHTVASKDPFWRRKLGKYQCTEPLESLVAVELDKVQGNIGWTIDLKQPYPCTWFKVEQTKITHQNEKIDTGKLMQSNIRGYAFVYLDQGEIQWNLDNITIHEEILNKQTFVEKF